MRSTRGFLDFEEDALDLEDPKERIYRRFHIFQENDVHAVNASLAARRPLLLRGRPGTGKSQLALAAAVGLGRAFVSEVIDARTESRDLLWRFDAVHRLADAQLGDLSRFEYRRAWLEEKQEKEPVAEAEPAAIGNPEAPIDLLHESFYITPGPLWWAFDWEGAALQARRAGYQPPSQRRNADPTEGVVLLLDEIDKADPSVPNGLLGALGDGEFTVPGVGRIQATGKEPLVVLTTNEERSLPDAFFRRCAVHRLELDRDETELEKWLVRLGEAHFEELARDSAVDPDPKGGVVKQAARLVIDDRRTCLREEMHPPGSAEYLDLLRAVDAQATTYAEKKGRLDIAKRFLLEKHTGGELR